MRVVKTSLSYSGSRGNKNTKKLHRRAYSKIRTKKELLKMKLSSFWKYCYNAGIDNYYIYDDREVLIKILGKENIKDDNRGTK